jgi:hypothetical protein
MDRGTGYRCVARVREETILFRHSEMSTTSRERRWGKAPRILEL